MPTVTTTLPNSAATGDLPAGGGRLVRFLQSGTAGIIIALAGAAVTIPILILLVLSFQDVLGLFKGSFTLENYIGIFGDKTSWLALRNTVYFTIGGATLSVALGTVMAWGVTSLNLPFRNLLRVLPVCTLILPPLVKDPAWIIMFNPDTGLVNLWLKSIGLPRMFNVFSLAGMISVAGFFSAPMAYIIMLTPFEGIHRSLIEASQMAGARLPRTFFRVALPMILPALLSAVTLIVIVIASAFETPVIIGMPGGIQTYMSLVYQEVSSPAGGLNVAATQGVLYLVLTLVMVAFYLLATRNERRFVAIAGKGHETLIIKAPVLRWLITALILFYCLMAFVGPLVITALTSLIRFYTTVDGNPFKDFTFANYHEVWAGPQVREAVVTSGLLALATSLGVVLLSGLLAFVALKTKSRFRRICEYIAMAPIAIPAIVYSAGLLLTVLSVPGLAPIAYGGKAVMIVAMIITFLPLTMRMMTSSLIQIQDELIDASILSGASVLRTIRLVLLPILRPVILYAIGVVFVMSYRELGAVVLLVANNTVIVPYTSFVFWETGGYPMLSALNMVTLIVPLVLLLISFGLNRTRRGSDRTIESPVAAVTQPAIGIA